ncbi:MAG: NTP transferase domain-containing protein [Candidatus Latescibacteria bacterium]|nr:NTP transferase domain-containing protein [Candidatus Latescibacterota bacterium]
MKAIIPVAGEGTRLRPHTHTIPKAMMPVAGKPIIGHILDTLISLQVNQVILIVGHLGDKIIEFVKDSYPRLQLKSIHQKERKGLGHAVLLAKDLVAGEPVLIVYGDTVFEGEFSGLIHRQADASIGVKEVEDPTRFGVVETKGERIIRMVEKPTSFVSNLAIVGFNYVNNSPLLFECLEELVRSSITTRGEYQLTDAFQLMVEKGAKVETFRVENWFDCGKPETLLETNRYLLEKSGLAPQVEGSVVNPPVFISGSAKVVNSIVGPYVSIADKAIVEDSIVRNSIIGEEAEVRQCLLEGSLIGANARIKGLPYQVSLGDFSEIEIK